MSKEMKELQKGWHSVMETVHSNPHVVAFMNSRVGQYLDDHPFVALSMLVFIAASAIPVAFFLVFVVATTVIACIGVIVMEGILFCFVFMLYAGGIPPRDWLWLSVRPHALHAESVFQSSGRAENVPV
ncbi:Uncharacterized protein PODLI_1B038593 [Podarcis lilfordi]|uniref:Promethin n=1 Tax=Podarcis lilfordi TaxID=74358 RepID=A0AA35L9M1_9SAUR|nr:Uncharacterized protein PODLI_1B038593 [Podarcis lilfordi]